MSVKPVDWTCFPHAGEVLLVFSHSLDVPIAMAVVDARKIAQALADAADEAERQELEATRRLAAAGDPLLDIGRPVPQHAAAPLVGPADG